MEYGLNKQEEQEYKQIISKATELLTTTVEDQINELNTNSEAVEGLLNSAKRVLENSTNAVNMVRENNNNRQLLITKLFEKKVKHFDLEKRETIKKAIININDENRNVINNTITNKILNGVAVLFLTILIGCCGFAYGKKTFIESLKTESFNNGHNDCQQIHKDPNYKYPKYQEMNYEYFSQGREKCEAELKQKNNNGGLK